MVIHRNFLSLWRLIAQSALACKCITRSSDKFTVSVSESPNNFFYVWHIYPHARKPWHTRITTVLGDLSETVWQSHCFLVDDISLHGNGDFHVYSFILQNLCIVSWINHSKTSVLQKLPSYKHTPLTFIVSQFSLVMDTCSFFSCLPMDI